jgi:DNA polymerase-2
MSSPEPPGVSGDLPVFRGFIVHAYADTRRDRLYVTGRLEDGRSFAAVESRWRPSFHIYASDRERCRNLLASVKYEAESGRLAAFSGREKLILLRFSRYGERQTAVKLLEQAGIPCPGGDMKPAEMFLSRRFIRGPVEIRGGFRPGRRVDLVFPEPELASPDEPVKVPLRIASIDIETNTRDNSIRAAACVFTDSRCTEFRGLVRVLAPAGFAPETSGPSEAAADTTEVTKADTADPAGRLVFHPDEASLLRGFIADIEAADPDVLTGWNFLDFDFPRLEERCKRLGIPFLLGRSPDPAKYFAGSAAAAERSGGEGGFRDAGRRSAAALVPGRQVIDSLRIIRSGPVRYPDYTLETVARTVLGEGKLVAQSGDDKIAALDRLYAEDPERFGRYCYTDAELVPRLLAKTGLFALTVERAALTGVSLDKAWTSVVSFERIYGMELYRRGIAPAPPSPAGSRVSGASGGTVLEPLPGLFSNIAVFDFRSLYPTIIQTFNIDPFAHARTDGEAPGPALIEAPNGALFSREAGPLPELIAEYFAARRRALDAGDAASAHVYKILMNSFYGVLGTGACRYGRTELAGAITSFARKWLLLSQDWFTGQGCRVLYGDTDSLFAEIGLDDGAAPEAFSARGGEMARELNRYLAERIRSEYRLESFIELRFEKAYRRFMIPPLRGPGENRGRAKGYAGYLLENGGVSVEVKGMEAVRSDVTPLARHLQLELLELVFSGGGEAALRDRVLRVLRELRAGKLDGELVYRKRLSRPPESYTASTPPQVKAARLLGWKGRRGTVEFVWTQNGPEPASRPHAPFDYDHYTDSQVLPVACSIAAAAGWNTEFFPQKGRNRDALENGQLELEL